MSIHQTEQYRQQEAYRAVRARLFGPTPKRAPTPIYRDIPSWKLSETAFDAHVSTYRDIVRQCLSKLILENTVEPLFSVPVIRVKRPAKDIIDEVLLAFPGVTPQQIRSHRRTRNIVLPRQIAMYRVALLRPDLSLPAIGRLFGGRDHTTVLHAVRKITAMVEDGRLFLPFYASPSNDFDEV